jgi:hypothetical protein
MINTVFLKKIKGLKFNGFQGARMAFPEDIGNVEPGEL